MSSEDLANALKFMSAEEYLVARAEILLQQRNKSLADISLSQHVGQESRNVLAGMIQDADRELERELVERVHSKLFTRRYRTYAKFHGFENPREMLDHDTKEYPGGCMVGFAQWCEKMIVRFKDDINYDGPVAGQYQQRFDEYLEVLLKEEGPRGA